MPILITPNYVLSAGGQADHPHIGYQTWVRGLVDDDISVSSETADGPKDAVLRPDTHEYWQGDALPADIVIDFGQSRAVDYVGLAGHTIGSAGASVKVEHSPDAAAWTQFGSDLAPVNDIPIMFLDQSIARRYWRITFSGSGGVVPKLAVLYIGEVLAVQRSIYGGHSPAPLSRKTTLFQNMSDGGQFLGQYTRRRGVEGGVRLQNLTAPWYRTHFDLFVQAAREFPYFFAWRPVTWPLEIVYGWTGSNIKPSNTGKKDFMEVSFDIEGIGYLD